MSTHILTDIRVAVYARYSSASQREASIEDQVRRCGDFIARAGGVVDPNLVFADHAVSGASLQRPAFEKLMSMVTAKHRQIDPKLFQSAAVKSSSNCTACHKDADTGRFDDQRIEVPKASGP